MRQTVKVNIVKSYKVLDYFGYELQNDGKVFVKHCNYFTTKREVANMLYPIIKKGLGRYKKGFKHDIWWFKTCIKWVEWYKLPHHEITFKEKNYNSEQYIWWSNQLDYALKSLIDRANGCKEYKQYLLELSELASM